MLVWRIRVRRIVASPGCGVNNGVSKGSAAYTSAIFLYGANTVFPAQPLQLVKPVCAARIGIDVGVLAGSAEYHRPGASVHN